MKHLKVGDNAPIFEGVDQNNKHISLNDFNGKKVAIYFYPKDSTPGCTAQACSLRDQYSELVSRGVQVIGVSADSVASHQKFTEKQNLPFPLIADTERKVIEQFGVWGPKKFMGKNYDGIHRMTFLIDENGKIEQIWEKVNTKEHAKEILDFLK
jgi:thioredoxin-dependent peroxiredoxin